MKEMLNFKKFSSVTKILILIEPVPEISTRRIEKRKLAKKNFVDTFEE